MSRRTNQLLYDERQPDTGDPPLEIFPSLVARLNGNFTKATILQRIHRLSTHPNSGVEHDGHHWIWKTANEWVSEVFPWLKPYTISKCLRELEAERFIVSTTRIFSQWDSTKFYRIDYDFFDENMDRDPEIFSLSRRGTAKLRESLLAERGESCEWCGNEERIEMHHKIQVADGGENTPKNCILLCHECHRGKAHKNGTQPQSRTRGERR